MATEHLTDQDLESLLGDLESDRVERKSALSDPGKIREAICAFSNDLPNHKKPGVVFVGSRDDGSPSGFQVTDKVLLQLSDMRSDGNILPFPVLSVEKRHLLGADMAVVIVEPSTETPHRYNGRTWIRVGPRRATATRQEEVRLSEKRRAAEQPFDLRMCRAASLEDLDLVLFERVYLPAAVSPEVLKENRRTSQEQLASVRFLTDPKVPIPTNLGVLVIGKEPTWFLPGAYVQFLRVDGADLADPIKDAKVIAGPLVDLLRRLDDVLTLNISTAVDVTSAEREIRSPDYPLAALQQLVRNAIMHRSYEGTNAPVRITWFSDRVEVQSPGGPFGQVTETNFGEPGIADYRNHGLAEAMRNLGYVQRFGVGIPIARTAMAENGNPPIEFRVESHGVLAILRKKP